MDKVLHARRWLEKIPVMYEQLMRMHPDGMPSLGMVARWDRIGGFSSNASSITETVAMMNLSITDAQREMLGWLDSAYDVFFRLNDATRKSPAKLQHDRKLAVVLDGKVFKGQDYETIRDMHFRSQVSPQYVRKLFADVVNMVAAAAEKRGLYKQYLE